MKANATVTTWKSSYWAVLRLATVVYAAVVLAGMTGAGKASAADGLCPNESLRGAASGALPNCRAYEMVSPVEKGNLDIGQVPFRETFSGGEFGLPYPVPSQPFPPFGINLIGSLAAMPVSADGDQALLLSFAAFAGSPYGGGKTLNETIPGLFYVAERDQGEQRWETVPVLTQRYPTEVGRTGPAAFGEDLMEGFFASKHDLGPGCTESSGECVVQRSRNGEMKLMFTNRRAETVIVNASGATAAFESTSVLTADPGVPSSGFKAYAWRNDDHVLVSKLPDGTPVNGAIGSAVMGGETNLSQGSVMHAISEEGDHVFFSTNPTAFGEPPPSTNVYRRDLDGGTILASPSKRSTPDPLGPKAKVYFDATPDQSASGPAAVFFASAEKLTDDATTGPTGEGNDLYRYEINTDTLTDISVNTNDANGAQVVSVIGASHDGKRVYYVAKGQIVAGKGVAGGNNVYLWTDDGTPNGTNRFIATLGATDAAVWDVSRGLGGGLFTTEVQAVKSARVSDDGTRLLLESQQSLTGYDSNGLTEVFIYDALADGGAGQLSCISCRFDGAPSSEGAMVPRTSAGSQVGGEPTRALSADGRRAFFETRDPVVPKDVNGKMDVYQWEDGKVSLISSGLGEFDTYFHGASASGDDVFILTRDQLAPQDPDDLYDVYDARVNGGFVFARADAPCTGEDCKAVATPQPETAAPGSATLAGARNESSSRKAPRRCRTNQRQVKRKGKVRCVKKRKPASRRKQSRNSSTRNGG